MVLPQVLIIGAMKAGTTTLWRDLHPHPDLGFPRLRKEPQILSCAEHDLQTMRDRYSWFFALAKPGQILCDPSTRYAALPRYEGVPQRAEQLLGTDLRIIYMIREPIERIVSHHHHGYADGWLDPSIDTAIRKSRQLVSLSMYASQITPWLDVFGPERIKVVRLDDYALDRAAGLTDVCRFLDLDPAPALARLRPNAIYNRGSDRRAKQGPALRLIQSRVYRKLKRRLPVTWDHALRTALLPPVPPRSAPPSPGTIESLAERLGPELQRFASILGADRPPWDIHDAASLWTQRYHEHRAQSESSRTRNHPRPTHPEQTARGPGAAPESQAAP